MPMLIVIVLVVLGVLFWCSDANNRCPKCGSYDIKKRKQTGPVTENLCYYEYKCNKCGKKFERNEA